MRRIERIILRHQIAAARQREIAGHETHGPRPPGDVPPEPRPGDWMPLCSVPNLGYPRKVRAHGGAREALERAREAWAKLDMQIELFPREFGADPEVVRASQLDRR